MSNLLTCDWHVYLRMGTNTNSISNLVTQGLKYRVGLELQMKELGVCSCSEQDQIHRGCEFVSATISTVCCAAELVRPLARSSSLGGEVRESSPARFFPSTAPYVWSLAPCTPLRGTRAHGACPKRAEACHEAARRMSKSTAGAGAALWP